MPTICDHSISASRALSSGCKGDLGFGHHAPKVVRLEESGREEVDLPAEHPFEFLLHANEAKAGRLAFLELDEDVHIACGTEVVAYHRTEEVEVTNVVATAEVGERLSVDLDAKAHWPTHPQGRP
jgi:hypothetical protein